MPSPLDRAWARRPLVSPPPFGRSVPAIWADTEVTFLRRQSTNNDIGGTGGEADLTVLIVMANVALSPEPGLHIEIAAGGAVRRRYYMIIFDIPPDPLFDWDTLPQKGDYVTFTDAGGRITRTPVKSVLLPENLADHCEVETEEFD